MSVEILLRAADVVDAKASLAAAGPWTCSPVWSPDSHATSAVYSNGYPTGTVESEVVGSSSKRKGYGGIKNPHNAVYITLMQPRVAGALAPLLRHAAKTWDATAPEDRQYALDVALALLGEVTS